MVVVGHPTTDDYCTPTQGSDAKAAAVEQLLIKLFHHIDFPVVTDTLPGSSSDRIDPLVV